MQFSVPKTFAKLKRGENQSEIKISIPTIPSYLH